MAQRDPELTVLMGPMFSGKSTEMYRLLEQETYANRKFVVLKWDKDLRASEDMDTFCTHGDCHMNCIRVPKDLRTLDPDVLDGFHIVGIDDAHFFEGLRAFCERCLDQHKMDVVVSGLDGDYTQTPFRTVTDLAALAEQVRKLHARCRCGRNAYFSIRTTKQTERYVVGSADMYKAVCRRCLVRSRQQ